MTYHGKVVGPNGQTYLCEHNHRTLTAAITCANSSATRRMAAMEWNRAAVQAAQRAALARKRAEERAAAQARRVAAQEASAARRAAAQAAAEEAKAAKRVAKLAAMPPQRAWKKMTPEERLLKVAEAELGVYGEIVSSEAKAAYEKRAAKRAAASAPEASKPALPSAAMPSRAQAADAPAYMRALDPSLSPYERARAKEQASGDPEQWRKYVAALRAQQADRDSARLTASTSGGGSGQAGDVRTARPAIPGSSLPLPPPGGAPPNARPAATEPVRSGSGLRSATTGRPGLTGDIGGGAGARRSGGNAAGDASAGPSEGFSGDGLFVVGLDITPGVYRTAGPVSGHRGYFALLKSTSTRDIMENSIVAGPATITVGPGVRAVEVRRCQPWSRLGDNLDAVIAAASKKGNTAR